MHLNVFELNEVSFKLTLPSVFNGFPIPLFMEGDTVEMCVLFDVSKFIYFPSLNFRNIEITVCIKELNIESPCTLPVDYM
jgi:hypothetical protein